MGNSASEYQFGNPALSSNKRLTLNIFGQNQKLWFAGDFDPTQASNVNLAALEQIVPVARGSRTIHPLGPNNDNFLPQTLADGTVVQTPITDNLSWNTRNFMLGPPSWNQDISAFKYFNFTERIRLRMSGDFFNAFNHPTAEQPESGDGTHQSELAGQQSANYPSRRATRVLTELGCLFELRSNSAAECLDFASDALRGVAASRR